METVSIQMLPPIQPNKQGMLMHSFCPLHEANMDLEVTVQICLRKYPHKYL